MHATAMALFLRTSSFALRTLLLLGLLALAEAPSAQTALRLSAPILLVDGTQQPVVGAPLQQMPFARLVLTVPGSGTYRISDRPFPEAHRSGQFVGETLAFSLEGRSFRLQDTAPLLGTQEPRNAYVRVEPAPPGRGPARLSLDPDDSGATVSPALAHQNETLAALDRERMRLSESIARLEADRARAVSEGERLTAERQRILSESAPLQEALNAYTRDVQRFEAERARLMLERERMMAETGTTSRESDAFAADLRRIQTERERLIETQQQLAAAQQALARQSETLNASIAELQRETERISAERDRLSHEQDRIIRERDAVLDAQSALATASARLNAEQRPSTMPPAHRAPARERSGQPTDTPNDTDATVRQIRSEVGQLRAQTETVTLETERLLAERNRLRTELAAQQEALARARAERAQALMAQQQPDDALAPLQTDADRLRSDIARLSSEVQVLRRERAQRAAERDSLSALPGPDTRDRRPRTFTADEPTPNASPRLQARLATAESERDAYAVTIAAMRRENEETADQVRVLNAEIVRARQDYERLQADREQLARERDALHREAEQLRGALLNGAGAPAAAPARGGGTIALPGFSYDRLQNAAEVRDLVERTPYPARAQSNRTGGDLLVLFVTDAQGRVVETAIDRTLGDGLDALAEQIVLAMRFIPPVVDGQPTALRSQVVVRFAP